MRLAAELNVEFAFPTQTLHIAGTPERPFQAAPAAGRPELASIVDRFGPGGDSAQRVDRPITAGYDNG